MGVGSVVLVEDLDVEFSVGRGLLVVDVYPYRGGGYGQLETVAGACRQRDGGAVVIAYDYRCASLGPRHHDGHITGCKQGDCRQRY